MSSALHCGAFVVSQWRDQRLFGVFGASVGHWAVALQAVDVISPATYTSVTSMFCARKASAVACGSPLSVIT